MTPPFISRAAAGLRGAARRVLMARSLGFFIHYTAGKRARNRTEGLQRDRQVQNFHMDTKAWSDIAYSFLVDDEGTIYEGRGWGVVGGHTQGHNSTAHAFCAMLNAGDQPTPEMLRSLRWLADEHDRRYGAGFRRVHRDVGSTSCPGDPLNAWVKGGMVVPGGAAPAPAPAPAAPAAPVDLAAVRRWVAGVAGNNLSLVRSTVRNGSRGGDVKAVQQALNVISGAGLKEDGVFGSGTEAKVRDYQRWFRLAVDGVVGPATRGHMIGVLALIRDGKA